jgi:hypothetical protein
MPIYWGTFAGPQGTVPMYLLGWALFFMFAGTWTLLNEHDCPPAPVCVNCQEGMSINDIITDPDNFPSCPVG